MFSKLSHKMRFQNFRIKCNGIRKLLKCCFTLIGIKAVDVFLLEYSCIENNKELEIDYRRRQMRISFSQKTQIHNQQVRKNSFEKSQ